MNNLSELKLNKFQLNVLLNDEQKETYDYIVRQNVFCGNCGGICSKGITIKEIILDSLNDIHIRGVCNVCNGKVTRLLQFGENKEFYTKANEFRKSIKK